jgi:hypothetical protein
MMSRITLNLRRFAGEGGAQDGYHRSPVTSALDWRVASQPQMRRHNERAALDTSLFATVSHAHGGSSFIEVPVARDVDAYGTGPHAVIEVVAKEGVEEEWIEHAGV